MIHPFAFAGFKPLIQRQYAASKARSNKDFVMDHVISIITKYYKFEDSTWVTSKSRKREISQSRHILSHLCISKYKIQPILISRKTNKDHSTAWHSVKECNNLLETNSEFREEYIAIERLAEVLLP